MDLCHDTSIQFGERPPLFAKPPGYVEPPQRSGPGGARPQPALDAQDADLADLFLANPMMRCASVACVRAFGWSPSLRNLADTPYKDWAYCDWAGREWLGGCAFCDEARLRT